MFSKNFKIYRVSHLKKHSWYIEQHCIPQIILKIIERILPNLQIDMSFRSPDTSNSPLNLDFPVYFLKRPTIILEVSHNILRAGV